jgi:uncharacterized protein (TIGR00369 family)
MDAKESLPVPEGFRTLKNGPPAEDWVGPFYYKKFAEGLTLGFRAEQRHANIIGSVHGGVMQFFADYAVIMTAMMGQKESCATVSCSNDFVSGGKLGDWIEARAEVTRRAGNLIFITGHIYCGEKTLLNFQSVVRRLGSN